MSYRPLTDFWLLARPKVSRYGSYPNGLLERARALLGITPYDSLLHVCGGLAKDYPGKPRGFGPNDKTLDLDPAVKPDFLQDVMAPLPRMHCGDAACLQCTEGDYYTGVQGHLWPAIIADPPYTESDSLHYSPGEAVFPNVNLMLRNMITAVRLGGRIGILHYILPQPPKDGVKFVACVGVIVGYNNRIRVLSVFERTA